MPAILRRIEFGHIFPIDQVIDEGLEIVGAAIAVVDVVGMLPHVDSRGSAWPPWTSGFSPFGVLVTVILPSLTASQAQPEPNWVTPAWMKSSFILATEPRSAIDLFELAGDLVAAAVRLHPFPEMDVVVVLAGIVEEPGILAERALDDLLERLAFPLGALEQIVAVVT